jgi:hypothetical protein
VDACAYSPGPPRDELVPFLRLLAEVITLLTMPDIASATALDWYRDPSDDLGSYDWPNSEVGQLVNLGKYRLEFHPNLRARYGHAGHLYRAAQTLGRRLDDRFPISWSTRTPTKGLDHLADLGDRGDERYRVTHGEPP